LISTIAELLSAMLFDKSLRDRERHYDDKALLNLIAKVWNAFVDFVKLLSKAFCCIFNANLRSKNENSISEVGVSCKTWRKMKESFTILKKSLMEIAKMQY
jgi:hypothetical protein